MKLLVTGAWNCTEEQLAELENMGYDVVFHKMEKEPLPIPYSEIDGVICNGLFLYHDIEKFNNLKIVQLTSAGLDRVPIEYIKSRDIKIFNAAGVYSIPMAEFAISGILQLYKDVRFFSKNQAEHTWTKKRDLLELNGKKVLIAGAGNVGQECAKRLAAFGCETYGVDIVPTQNPYFEKIFHILQIKEILPVCDIVVLTLPLTNETHHLFNREMFSFMKQNSVLVNISRGAVVDTEELIKTIASKKLYGAVIDVFENEPLKSDSALWNYENVILTPHNSFVGDGNGERLFSLIKNNLKKDINL